MVQSQVSSHYLRFPISQDLKLSSYRFCEGESAVFVGPLDVRVAEPQFTSSTAIMVQKDLRVWLYKQAG